MDWEERFQAVTTRKIADAAHADIARLTTVRAGPLASALPSIGNAWTSAVYDGEFHQVPLPADVPAVSLVFVQDAAGNTAIDRPEDLGGGATDLHAIYEGLSRVATDAVLAGAATARGAETFFSVWHPEIVALRLTLGLARHPAQIVVSSSGNLDFAGTLLFNIPAVPVFILAGPDCQQRCAVELASRPWIRIVALERGNWRRALTTLREEHGVSRISAIGGRTTASSLIDAGLVQDLLLTTTSRRSAEPATPFYTGSHPPRFELIVEKRGTAADGPIKVEHLAAQ